MSQYKLMWLLTILTVLLQACSGGSIPLSEAGIAAITQQATVTGVYMVKTGAQPLGQILENVQGTQIVIWPGARMGTEQIWNFACLAKCGPGWPGEVTRYLANPGYALSWMRMSQFVQALKADGWKVVPMAVSTGETIGGVLQQMAGALTGFCIFPVGAIPTETNYQS